MQDRDLTDISFEIFNFKCFDDSGSGELRLRPINFVIGRNNAGKSAIVDFISIFLAKTDPTYDVNRHGRGGVSTSFNLTQKLFEDDLRPIFRENSSGGALGGNHWAIGKTLDQTLITFLDGPGAERTISSLENPGQLHPEVLAEVERLLLQWIKWPLNEWGMTRVAAERDVRPEPMSNAQNIQPSGAGLTNAIMRQIADTSRRREVIEESVLADLNEVYQGDALFTDILTRIDGQNNWEVYLREQTKGDIRLSESGSGLKTVLLISTLVRIRPPAQWTKHVFAIDEPENNLHPALFRRLLEYLARMRDELGFVLIVTTHSPVGIDWAARRKDSQVIHITHDGVRAKTAVADGYAASQDILDDLDMRASDLLQANGIIWVEGPSDRIYLRRWIDLFTCNSLKEGIHYTIMFYGGKLLSHLSCKSPDDEEDLIALLRLNRNSALLVDSDRRLAGIGKSDKIRKPRMQINKTKMRIKDELEAMGGIVWITAGREIENYIPESILSEIAGQSLLSSGEYDSIIELAALKAFNKDKIKLAHAVSERLSKENAFDVLDLPSQLEKLSDRIRSWNSIATVKA